MEYIVTNKGRSLIDNYDPEKTKKRLGLYEFITYANIIIVLKSIEDETDMDIISNYMGRNIFDKIIDYLLNEGLVVQKPDTDKPVFRHFPEARESVRSSKCPFCGISIKMEDFKDDLSRKEFSKSGLCQVCQDKVFVSEEE